MLDEETRARFEDALRRGDLKGLCDRMKLQGLSQVAIYDLFASFALALRDEGRDVDEETVGDGSLDFTWGWRSRDKMWFDRGLTDDDVKAYRREKGQPG
ncbi:MAG: hypothetical protein HYR84_12600 [Planctomycetes bacterium]|nr:hypothetical protein [Planctomycetota bacterium]